MPGISVSKICVPFGGGGIDWSSYWTTQDEVLFFGLYSEIAGGQMPNKKAGATDYLTVAGAAGSETYQAPNTAAYITADTDYVWFTRDGAQRTVTTAELIGYDLQRTPVKYEDDSPNEIVAIIILSSAVTEDKRDRLFMDMWLPILWDNSLNNYGHIKSNRITQNIWQHEIGSYTFGLTTPLSKGQVTLLETFVKSIKSGLSIYSLSDAFDVIYIFGGETPESSLRNLVKNANHATAVNSPGFTQYEGFDGNGSSSYINTNYNPITHGDKYTLNSASMGVYTRVNNNLAPAVMGARKGYGDDMAYLNPRHLDGLIYFPINQDATTNINAAAANSLGITIISRTASNMAACYRNKNNIKSFTESSSSMPNYNFYVLANNEGGTPGCRVQQVAFAFVGRGMSAADVGIIVDAIEVYMDAHGKGVI